MAPGSLLIG